MGAKRFHIATPDELRELEALAIEQPSGLWNAVRVWTATKRMRGKTAWDHCFYACFSGTRHREASIIRFNTANELVDEVPIHYNKALNWCEKHLREV